MIQSPTSTQSINPYSYVMNNPLAGTDPTGYCSTGTNVKGHDAAGCQVAYINSDGKDPQGKKKGPVSNGASPKPSSLTQLPKQTSEIGGQKQVAEKGSAAKFGEGGESDPKLRSPVSDSDWSVIQEKLNRHIGEAKSTVEALSSPESDGYSRLAFMYGYGRDDFGEAAKDLIEQFRGAITFMNGLLDNRSYFYRYKVADNAGDYGESTSQGIGLSDAFFRHSEHYNIGYTVLHEVGHKIGLNHDQNGFSNFGVNRQNLVQLSRIGREGDGTYPYWRSQNVSRDVLKRNVYQFVNAIKGDDYTFKR
ncbi:hypothetical protein EDC28_103315 [Gallaecimonas pentaromativorans]|uniref:RHS repeat-associated protein n=2 Tax=Gallaecimonas pentaromativorans TaxID=584787 RepID=A0A3N1PNL9_9GAMM|nr:hypothetical protein EDC28_103315 [Gallaecimonas pentaromativorans]